uniref:Uncharacterized protein n=1 Tax=Oryza rufipogon TaxID=4529 RepID=A0A0E0RB81_ORYRU
MASARLSSEAHRANQGRWAPMAEVEQAKQ